MWGWIEVAFAKARCRAEGSPAPDWESGAIGDMGKLCFLVCL